jgi:hypothetical protein
MVRRGSTVRVRQRALQNASLTPFLFSDLLAGARTWGRYGALYGAFRSRTPSASFLLELAAFEPATSWLRTRGPEASPALTGCPDDSTSLDAAQRQSGGLQRRRSRWRALDAMRTRKARLVYGSTSLAENERRTAGSPATTTGDHRARPRTRPLLGQPSYPPSSFMSIS